VKHEAFKQEIIRAVNEFNKFDKDKIIRLVSHLDADGICACSIIVRALVRLGRRYSISIISQLDSAYVDELSEEDNEYYIFTDLGSGQILDIKNKFKNKKVLILDHHEPQTKEEIENIIHINPHLLDINGSDEISGSGVVYLFAKELDPENKTLAHIALIGAIGDMQERGSFNGFNVDILKDAVETSKIIVKKGLRLFGTQTKPLHRVLEYSTDPVIPGVTGSESNAIEFLQSLGINPKHGTRWRKMNELTDEEIKKLIAAVVSKRKDEDSPEDILGNIYILTDEEDGKPTRDAKEFSTLLNACGRMNKASLGIGCCLNDPKLKEKAISALGDYRKEIVSALRWYEANQDGDLVYDKNGYVIINAKDNISHTIIGTLASIISKSNDIKEGKFILSMAQQGYDKVKISMRIAGRRKGDVDLRDIISKIVSRVGEGQAGGHMNAAGAIISADSEEEFLKVSKQVLDGLCMEECV